MEERFSVQVIWKISRVATFLIGYFPWDFQGIFKFFPEQLKREKFAAIHYYLGLCYISYIFSEFSRFFFKNSNFPEFSRFSTISRFVATLISLKIIKNPGQLKFTDLPHGILFCLERPGILEETHKSNFFTQSILWTLFPDASFLISKASTQQNLFFKKKPNKILGLLIVRIGTKWQQS